MKKCFWLIFSANRKKGVKENKQAFGGTQGKDYY